MSTLCKYVKGNGEPCQAGCISGSDYCYWHSPELAHKRAEARKRGGFNRQTPKRSNPGPYSIQGVDDIVKVLQDALNDACALENSHARSRTIGYLCMIALRTLEVGELEYRVRMLEERLGVVTLPGGMPRLAPRPTPKELTSGG